MNIKGLSPLLWTIIIGILILRVGTSMSIPFLSIFLHFKIGLSLAVSGLIAGTSYLSYAFGGFFGGVLSDRYGRRKLLSFSLFAYPLIFFGFGLLTNVHITSVIIAILFFALNLVGGLFRAWSETLAQVVLSDIAKPEQKITVFSLRYTALNIGVAIGPLLGTSIGFSGTSLGFYLTGVICFIYFILFALVSRQDKTLDIKQTSVTLLSSFHTLRKDKAFLYFILGGFLAYLVYSQQESTLGQIIVQKFHTPNLFAILLTINALTVICLQIPITHFTMKIKSPLYMIKIGCLLLALGLLGIAYSGNHYIAYIGSEVIFSLGEILIFPLGAIFIDNIASEALRGSYFGSIGFMYLGKAVGPFLGGALLQVVNGELTLTIFAIIAIGTIIFYTKGNKVPTVDVN